MDGNEKLYRLDRILSGRGALPPEVVVELGYRICEAVDEAWRVDLGTAEPTDRELQPGTIYITPDGWIPIGDLGLSDLEAVHGDPTAVYRAPETLEGHGDHPTADVFVIGSILYEMATGDPLFHGRRAASGDSLTSGLQLRLSVAGVPDKLDELVPGLGKVVLRCLQLDHTDRWPEAGIVGRALQKVQKHADLKRPELAAFLAGDPTDELEADPPEEHGIEIAFGEPLPPPPPFPPPLVDTSSLSDPFSLQDEVFVEEVEAAKPDPWATDEETEEEVVARVTRRRLTPVARPPSQEEEPTFGKAVKWFVKRVVLALILLLLLAFALAWLGLFPGGTERQVARAWEAIPEGVRGVVPDGWVTGVQAYWVDRPAQAVATPVGRWLLGVMPEGVNVALSEEPPTPPPTPGTPVAEGVIESVEGWIEPEEGVPVESGKLTLGVGLGGRARGEKVRVIAHAADGATTGEGTADQPLMLPPGAYDIELVYRESELSDEYRGWLRGVHLTGGWATHFAVSLTAPIGFVQGSFERDDEDLTAGVRLEGWREPIDDEPEGEPAFVGAASEVSGLQAGRWRFRATLQEEGRAIASHWFTDVVVETGERTTVQRSDFALGELLEPAGPGVRIAATNQGRDVSERSQVFVFSAGAEPGRAVAMAQGPAGYYFDVPAGTWDLQIVYAPDPTNPTFRAEKRLTGVTIEEGLVARETVEMGLPLAALKVRVRHDEVDISKSLLVSAINAGASYEGATRAVDAFGTGPHPIEPGPWDVYLELDLDGTTLRALYEDVEVAPGDVWVQLLATTDPVWKR